jgi:hypothetical protein
VEGLDCSNRTNVNNSDRDRCSPRSFNLPVGLKFFKIKIVKIPKIIKKKKSKLPMRSWVSTDASRSCPPGLRRHLNFRETPRLSIKIQIPSFSQISRDTQQQGWPLSPGEPCVHQALEHWALPGLWRSRVWGSWSKAALPPLHPVPGDPDT